MKYVLIVIVILFSLFFPQFAFADAEINVCPTNTKELNFNILCRLQPTNALPSILTFIIIAAVVISLFFLIWGGIKWITSSGDKAKVESARSHIVAAIVGLIVVFLAWFIINFILTTFFGGSLNQGLTLPAIMNGGQSDTSTGPTVTPLPPANENGQTNITPSISPVPPCPTAYPPDFICQMPPETAK